MTCLADLLRAGDDVALGVAERLPVVVRLRDAGLAEVLAHHDVGGELRPLRGDLGVVHLEDDRAVGIGDPAGALLVLDGGEDVLSRLGESASDLHFDFPCEWPILIADLGCFRFLTMRPVRGRCGPRRRVTCYFVGKLILIVPASSRPIGRSRRGNTLRCRPSASVPSTSGQRRVVLLVGADGVDLQELGPSSIGPRIASARHAACASGRH